MSLFDNLARIWKAPLPDGEKVVLAQKEIESNQNVLIDRMLHIRKGLDPAKLQWFSDVIPISLATAHTNLCIWNRGGRGLFIVEFNGTPATTLLRFNSKSSSIYPVRSGYVKGAFKSLYLTSAAEAGKTLKFVIGYRNFAEYMMLGTSNIVKIQDSGATIIDPATTGNITTLMQTLMDATTPKDLKDLYDELAGISKEATTPTIYNVVMTTATQEYSQALPAGTKSFLLQTEDGTPFRMSFVADHAGNEGGAGAATRPYKTILSGSDYYEARLKLTDKTVYFACDTAAKYMEIVAWV